MMLLLPLESSKSFRSTILAFLLVSSSLFSFCIAAPSSRYSNITITAPDGTSNHGDQHLICVPSRWHHILTFFFTNFIAHAATVRSFPGESPLSISIATGMALFCPTFGVFRGLSGIFQHAALSGSPIQVAQRAGALWMVVRTSKWQPQDGDEIEFDSASLLETEVETKMEGKIQRHPPGTCLNRNHTIGSRDDFARYQQGYRGQEEIHQENQYSLLDSVSVEGTSAENIPRIRVVVRQKNPGLENGLIASNGLLDLDARKIHGRCLLPEGYGLALVGSETAIDVLGTLLAPKPISWSRQAIAVLKYSVASVLIFIFVIRDAEIKEDFQEIEDSTSQIRSNLEGCKRLSYESYRTSFGFAIKQNLSGIQQRLLRMRKDGRAAFSVTEIQAEDISCSYGIVKASIAVFQIVSSAITLYQARGDQIQRYGFTAFGLTVAPYLVMSFVNGLGALLTPSYPNIFLVQTDVMDEASRRDGAIFSGQVGLITPSSARISRENLKFSKTSDGKMLAHVERSPLFPLLSEYRSLTATPGSPNTVTQFEVDLNDDLNALPVVEVPPAGSQRLYEPNASNRSLYCIFSLIGLLPLAIVGGLSRFQCGSSTEIQQALTIVSLLLTGTAGSYMIFISKGFWIGVFMVYLSLGTIFVGHSAMIAQMMMEYGHCIRIY